MESTEKYEKTVSASIGFAMGDGSEGVAFVALRESDEKARFSRVPFKCVAMPALEGRDVAYAALLAVCRDARRRGCRRVAFELDFEPLVMDLSDHRPVPSALSVPYVMLGCALNRFEAASIVLSRDAICRDLTARARAEVSLHVAA